jgi:coiled-coil domain-containing protein 12
LERKAAELEEEVRRKAAEEEQEGDKGIDLFKLQPKKPNWDLKRELAKKMEILNVRTDNAIARLVRERLEMKKEEARKEGRPGGGEAEGEGVLEGTAMVEGLRMREREEEEEERREREEGDGL